MEGPEGGEERGEDGKERKQGGRERRERRGRSGGQEGGLWDEGVPLPVYFLFVACLFFGCCVLLLVVCSLFVAAVAAFRGRANFKGTVSRSKTCGGSPFGFHNKSWPDNLRECIFGRRSLARFGPLTVRKITETSLATENKGQRTEDIGQDRGQDGRQRTEDIRQRRTRDNRIRGLNKYED